MLRSFRARLFVSVVLLLGTLAASPLSSFAANSGGGGP